MSAMVIPGNLAPWAVAGDATQGHRVWPEDEARFTTRRVSRIRHDFHQHPMFQLPALEALAHTLMPTGQCRFIRPGSTQGSAFSHDPAHPQGLSVSEVFRRIDEPGSWLALYNVESDPFYRAVLQSIVSDLQPLFSAEQGNVFMVTGFIFLSAPPAVTPFHIDRENNFWLQLRGRKTINVWEPSDRTTVSAKAVEDFIAGGVQVGVNFTEPLRERSHQWDVGPGDGVFFPSTSPHMTCTEGSWVKPGDGVSVSIGVNFYTDTTRRTAQVHQFNRLLRRLGASPAYPGESRLADAIKSPLGHWLAAARYRRNGSVAPPGAY